MQDVQEQQQSGVCPVAACSNVTLTSPTARLTSHADSRLRYAPDQICLWRLPRLSLIVTEAWLNLRTGDCVRIKNGTTNMHTWCNQSSTSHTWLLLDASQSDITVEFTSTSDPDYTFAGSYRFYIDYAEAKCE
jgi:hypothetical protein